MEWIIAFTIVGLYSAQLFLVCSEFLKPTPPQPVGGFTRRTNFRNLTPAQIAALERSMFEYQKRYSAGEKVNWKEEGF